MENTISTTLKHREHREWLSTLDFYQDEIKIFQKELFIVLTQHPDLPSIIEHVEEYRALFLRKLKTIDEIRYRIARHEAESCLRSRHQPRSNAFPLRNPHPGGNIGAKFRNAQKEFSHVCLS